MPTKSDTRNRLALALTIVCAVQFMVALDVTVVNVALPPIRRDLGFTEHGIQWVVSAYAIVFGGVLLLCGRLADLAGRRRVFMAGVALFGLASLAAGLAPSAELLIAARVAQGLGGALTTPAALALLMAAHPEGEARNRALGVWGSVSALGAAAGVFLGGVVIELASWEWIFLVNVPIAAAALVLAPLALDESRAPKGGFDVVGGALGTSGLALLVYAVGESSPRAAVAAVVLLALFVLRQARAADPLIPLEVFRAGSVAGANVVGALHGAIMLGSLLLLSGYLQDLLGLSPVLAGLALLALRGTGIVWAAVAARLTSRLGAKAVLVAGAAGMTGGLATFTTVSAHDSFLVDVLPGLLVLGLAIPFVFVPGSIAALHGVSAQHSGLASGLLKTSQWTGGALGLAAVSAAMSAHVDPASGLEAGFRVCTGIAVLALLAAVVALRGGLAKPLDRRMTRPVPASVSPD